MEEENKRIKMDNMYQGMTPELVKRAEEELGETEENRIQAIKELKRLIKDEPDFNPCTEDAFLTRFLRARKYNIDRAFITLKNYYLYKAQNSGVLTDLRPSDFAHVDEKVMKGCALEFRDSNQCLIGYLRIGLIDIDKVSAEDILAIAFIITEILLLSEATQIAGYCIVIDMSGFTLRKARRYASPTFLYKMVSAIQDTYPSRIKAFHIVNEPFYFDIIFSIMKPFLSEKLSKRFYFHGSNMESLHKFINPKILPEELGGGNGPADIYEKKFMKIMFEHEDYIVKMNKFGYTGKTLQKLKKDNPKAVYN